MTNPGREFYPLVRKLGGLRRWYVIEQTWLHGQCLGEFEFGRYFTRKKAEKIRDTLKEVLPWKIR
jgi:hypothetical protein